VQHAEKLKALVMSEPHLTDVQLSMKMGVSTRTVSRVVADLRKKNHVSVHRLRYTVGGNWVNLRKIEVLQ
jgi:DNA-binding transcriptional regulator LsrR (DeoR family)